MRTTVSSADIIERTVIIDSDAQKSLGSGIVRGTLGAMFLGPVGLVAGAASAKEKKTTTFLVLYGDGHRETVTTKTGSREYKKLLEYLDV